MDNDRIIIRDKYGHSKSVQTLQPKTAKDLMETEIVKPDEIVKGLLSVGASILAGEPKCGKSFIVMQMVLAVASGMPFLGMETRKCRVLYCDLESPNWLHQQRLELLCNDESSLDNIDIITQSDRDVIGTLGEGFEDQLLSYLESHMDCKLMSHPIWVCESKYCKWQYCFWHPGRILYGCVNRNHIAYNLVAGLKVAPI